MAMADYYEPWRIQEYVSVPTGFQPPFDIEWVYGDGAQFFGVFIQNQSTQMMVAQAQGISTRGRFVTSPDVPLRDGEVVRRERDDVFVRIIGDPVESPEPAESNIKVFVGEVSGRSIS